jgi:predicted metalloprotease with PDZ domain
MRFARSQPVVNYTLRVDSSALTRWSVEVRLRNVPDSFQLAMARHPEYDDRYSRFVEGLSITGTRTTPTITRADSAVWIVRASGGEAVVRYRIQLPPAERPQRAAWRPFLSPTGGLAGGPHAFMYVVGSELAPSHVKLELPAGWKIATALPPTSDPTVFFAPSVDVLVESPIFVGHFHDWHYSVDGVPHRVVYWSSPTGSSFDSVAFVGGLEKLSREAVALFGRAPYREYTFIFQDGAYGGLEHASSVTLGAPSDALAKDPYASIEEAAHEYLHTWNLMRIRPVEYTGVSYRAPTPSSGLWFSEGLTIFYADALLRRTGLPISRPTREAHVTTLIERYLGNSGATKLSAEVVSRAAYNAGPLALGDYSVSTHMQGELIGTLLDLVVRDATNGSRSMDDVMRLMLERHSGETGFTGRDIERAVGDVCKCNVTPFFDAHVRKGSPIDAAPYLRMAGLRMDVTREPAARDGKPLTDMRIAGWNREGERELSLRLFDPASIWGRAGLHTGDRIVTMNGAAVTTWPEMRALLSALKIGDSVRVVVARPTGQFATTVTIAGYDRPIVKLTPIATASPKQIALRDRLLQAR